MKIDNDFAEFLSGFAKAIKETKEKYLLESNFTYPMEIKGIKKIRNFVKPGFTCEAGSFVKVRPCEEEYEEKTYAGIFLGELAIDNLCRLNKETGELEIIPHTNAAIYVPDLKKIVFGCESWWTEIKDISELKEISDEDIENVWYVQLLKGMTSQNEGSDADEDK